MLNGREVGRLKCRMAGLKVGRFREHKGRMEVRENGVEDERGEKTCCGEKEVM